VSSVDCDSTAGGSSGTSSSSTRRVAPRPRAPPAASSRPRQTSCAPLCSGEDASFTRPSTPTVTAARATDAPDHQRPDAHSPTEVEDAAKSPLNARCRRPTGDKEDGHRVLGYAFPVRPRSSSSSSSSRRTRRDELSFGFPEEVIDRLGPPGAPGRPRRPGAVRAKSWLRRRIRGDRVDVE